MIFRRRLAVRAQFSTRVYFSDGKYSHLAKTPVVTRGEMLRLARNYETVARELFGSMDGVTITRDGGEVKIEGLAEPELAESDFRQQVE